MSTKDAEIPGDLSQKSGYHHGRLKDALIDAAYALIAEKGPEGFTLAEACRHAGVSAGAPYRHFADRAALVEAVAQRGFTILDERIETARDTHPPGSAKSIAAMGEAYIRFAEKERALFRLMFGRYFDPQEAHEARDAGLRCAAALFEAVEAWMREHQVSGIRVQDVALPVWTLVHGAASLHIDGELDVVAGPVDTEALVERAMLAMLAGLSGS